MESLLWLSIDYISLLIEISSSLGDLEFPLVQCVGIGIRSRSAFWFMGTLGEERMFA